MTQIIGRVLRQPHATHYSPDRLNTAHFYVHVDRNEVFNDIVEEVDAKLGVDLPDLKMVAVGPQSARARQLKPKLKREIPKTATNPADAVAPVELLLNQMLDYSVGGINTAGSGSRRVSVQAIAGASMSSDWEDYEEPSRVSARWMFHREVLRFFSRALDDASTADKRFDAQIGVGSPALLRSKSWQTRSFTPSSRT